MRCIAELVCAGHLRLPSAVLRTHSSPAVLDTDTTLEAGLCSVSQSGQRLLATSIAGTRVGMPSARSKQVSMQSESDDGELLLRQLAEPAPTERDSINTAHSERGADGFKEGSCCLSPLQLHSALHLAVCGMHRAGAVTLSQAAAIGITSGHSSHLCVGCTASASSVTAAADRPLLCTVNSALVCRGIVVAAAGAQSASSETDSLAFQSPLSEAGGALGRSNTGPAGNAILRRLPQAARLLRIEALVRLLFLLTRRPPQDTSRFSELHPLPIENMEASADRMKPRARRWAHRTCANERILLQCIENIQI